MTVIESLQSLNAYPLTRAALRNIAEENGIDADEEVTFELRSTKPFRKAVAGVYLLLAESPNITQDGISYSFSESERKLFKAKAAAELDAVGEEGGIAPKYGYKGQYL